MGSLRHGTTGHSITSSLFPLIRRDLDFKKRLGFCPKSRLVGNPSIMPRRPLMRLRVLGAVHQFRFLYAPTVIAFGRPVRTPSQSAALKALCSNYVLSQAHQRVRRSGQDIRLSSLASVHSEQKPISRADDPYKPLLSSRKCDGKGSLTRTGFR